MSSTLEWEPRYRKTKSLSDELKWALRQKNGGQCIDGFLSESDIPYLEGLRDAGIKDAQKVIDAIEKYSEIYVKEVY